MASPFCTTTTISARWRVISDLSKCLRAHDNLNHRLETSELLSAFGRQDHDRLSSCLRCLREVRLIRLKLLLTAPFEIAADLPAISFGIRDVFAQKHLVALNRRQSVFPIGARRIALLLVWHWGLIPKGGTPMFDQAIATSIALDARTLFIVASCVTALLGLLLLFAW